MSARTDDAVVAALIGIVSGVTGVPADQLPTDRSMRGELHIDSLGMLDVVLTIESRFRLRIPDAEMGRFADCSIQDAAIWICDARTQGVARGSVLAQPGSHVRTTARSRGDEDGR